jgi:hypothetical protein
MANHENSVSKFDSSQYSTLNFADFSTEISSRKRPQKFVKISKNQFLEALTNFFAKIFLQ